MTSEHAAKDVPRLAYDDELWGPLTIDREALLDALGRATQAVGEAVQAARWKCDNGYAIGSPYADILFGVNSTLDGLIDLLSDCDTDGPTDHGIGGTDG